MATPKITFMGIDPPKFGSVTNPNYAKISTPDLLVATGAIPNSIAQIETNHNLVIDENTYTGGLAIFGTKDGNSDMKAIIAGEEVNYIENLSNNYGKFVDIDSTHWMLLLTPAAVEAMGQGGESIKLTSTLNNLSFSSTTYVTVDTVAPTLFSSSPGNNDEEVAVDSNISLTYSENIKFGSTSGTITLDGESASGDITITINSNGAVTSGNATVSISGKTLTINPTGNLTTNNTYNVLVDEGLIQDTAGNDAAEIAEEVKFETTHIVNSIGVGTNGNMDYIGKAVDNGTYGVTLFGDDDGDVVGDQFGTSVSNAGDVNGDGYDDIIIGSAYADNPYSTSSGLAYVVFGGKNGLAIDVDDPDFKALNDLDGTNGGFIISSSSGTTVQLGRSVSSAGDLNGDGYSDLIVGATPSVASGDSEDGKSFVIYGKKNGFSNVDTSTFQFDPSNGFQLTNDGSTPNMGFAVSTLGDINGDGLADIAITAPGDLSGQSGETYIIFGNEDGYTNTTAQGLADGSATGFTFVDTTVDFSTGLGSSISDAGDVNNDGYDDFIVSKWYTPATTFGGTAFVVFGGDEIVTDAAELDGTNGFALTGTPGVSPVFGDAIGISVSSAGDVNGDGISDLVVGSMNGPAYVVFGHDGSVDEFDAAIDLSTNTDGFKISHTSKVSLDLTGNFSYSVSSAGDVNGDGYDDIIIGERGDLSDNSAGAAYVIFGGKTSDLSDINLDSITLDGSNGFKIEGASVYEHLGNSVSSAGDLNGDGFDDLIVGASLADSTGFSGSLSPVITSGSNSGNQVTFTYTQDGNIIPIPVSDTSASGNITVAYTNGVTDDPLTPVDEGTPGTAVFTFPALAAGEYVRLGGASGLTYTANHNLTAVEVAELFANLTAGYQGGDNETGNEGEAYVIYGSEHFGHKATHVGTAKADVLNGTTAANTFVSGRGNDLIFGKGGADAYNAGAGNDTIKVSDLNFRLVDGGSGTDTLSLAMAGKTLILADENISNIETIDLTGTGANTLQLTALDIFNMSDSSNKLIVKGNVGDKITFPDHDEYANWANVGTSGIYDKYTNGEAVLLVGQSITVVEPA